MQSYWDNRAGCNREVPTSYPPSQVICTPAPWSLEDVYGEMIRKGIPVTDANVEAILNGRFATDLKDRETEEGFEIIDILLDNISWPDPA